MAYQKCPNCGGSGYTKLRAVFGVYQAKLWNDDGPIIAEIASKKELFENVEDAINWLYETAKREGYLE